MSNSLTNTYEATFTYEALSSTNLTSTIIQGNQNIGTATLNPSLNTILISLITAEGISATYNYPSSVDTYIATAEQIVDDVCTLSPNLYSFSTLSYYVGLIEIKYIINIKFSIFYDYSTNYVTQSFIFESPIVLQN